MDDSGSSGAPRETRGSDDPGEGDPSGSTQGETFLSRLFRSAGDAWQTGVNVQNDDEEALGGALRESTPAELAMITNIIRLRDLRVYDVMIPRADIVAVAEDATLNDVMDAFQQGSFSRLPVYRETLDDPLGFVHLKDLALRYGVGCQNSEAAFSLTGHVRTALFVPPSMPIATLLQRMQISRVHMALVIDEFGGVDGIVTIEDLVEQIVGEIEDEHDAQDQPDWSSEKPGVYLVDARADIREFEAAEDVHLVLEDWEEDVDTLGGLVFMLANRVPVRGEVIQHPSGHEFQIVDADPRRIKRMRLTLSGAAGNMSSMRRQAAE